MLRTTALPDVVLKPFCRHVQMCDVLWLFDLDGIRKECIQKFSEYIMQEQKYIIEILKVKRSFVVLAQKAVNTCYIRVGKIIKGFIF